MTETPISDEALEAIRKGLEGVTPGPWKAVCRPEFGNGYTYTSVQPKEPNPETMSHLAMANGEYHVCRMTHTPMERKFRLYERDAAHIARLDPATVRALLARVEAAEATLTRISRWEKHGGEAPLAYPKDIAIAYFAKSSP